MRIMSPLRRWRGRVGVGGVEGVGGVGEGLCFSKKSRGAPREKDATEGSFSRN